MRPLPGAARMYPETDVLPVRTTQVVSAVKARGLPERPERVVSRLVSSYGLTQELAEMLLDDGRVALFERIVEEHPTVPVRFLASTLTSTLRGLTREGVNVDNIPERAFHAIAGLISSGKMAKEAVPELLRRLAEEPSLDPVALAESLAMSEEELDSIIQSIIEEEREVIDRVGMRAFGRLMGRVMSVVRGRIDGAIVSEKLRRALEERLSQK